MTRVFPEAYAEAVGFFGIMRTMSKSLPLYFDVHRSFFCYGGFWSEVFSSASNELYDAYRAENGYFGDLMN
ncbi:hypothetical protein GCM10008018_33260 [Paenibacillus marchantiophytorum]|uniref:Uncharacterized protein n=1 Tax=Paenibacillus marchantiophytorum TaxID=1619310 RepID=A0ABQ1ERU3_9BACL|nr:hypothetical protein GCM10008018_33260 [Paenibacillus marchantiophytorum]